MDKRTPAYLSLHASGELARRAANAGEIYRECRLCPHECVVDRTAGEFGECRSGARAMVSSHNAHYGEEPPISGRRGSGTIFFTNCTMRCLFCQNYPISQLGHGREVAAAELAGYCLELEKRGCHNINFVTPTHFVPSILEALVLAVEEGFSLPLVYNTSGYESPATLELLDGVIDIYMPDIKYSCNVRAKECSGCDDYVERNRAALKEMFRQVGLLELDEEGAARRGMLVRHLVLPEDRAGSADSLRWMAEELAPRLHLSVMSQYFPAHCAPDSPPLHRRVSAAEYRAVTELLDAGSFQGWTQPSR